MCNNIHVHLMIWHVTLQHGKLQSICMYIMDKKVTGDVHVSCFFFVLWVIVIIEKLVACPTMYFFIFEMKNHVKLTPHFASHFHITLKIHQFWGFVGLSV